MRWHVGYWLLGALLVLVGVLLPREWYDTIPKREGLPLPPIKGVTLFQISLVVEGLALFWLSLKRWTFIRLDESERLPVVAADKEREATHPGNCLWFLIAITALAFFLRVLRINSDLWLDEITPILNYGPMSILQVIGAYLSSNNHLLNTLLVKLTVTWFGETEWAIRLPAVIFGTASIPAIYWVARLLRLSRWASLSAALLLAVSYHHIFFSQNARGYAGYLLFSLLASGLLVKGLQEDRGRIWGLYILTMFLNLASLLNSGFVFASHVLVGGVWSYRVHRSGTSPAPLLRRLAAIFVVTAFLAFQLYAIALPQIYVFLTTSYIGPASGYAPFSGEFLRELLRGISAGFRTGLLFGAVPLLLLTGAGLVMLFRRQWSLTTALTMPVVLTAVFLIAQGLTFIPRFFLLALPLTILGVAQGIYTFAEVVGSKLGRTTDVFVSRFAAALVLVVIGVSLASLPDYYSVPKQPYRASIQYLQSERKASEIVIVIDIAEKGYRFYGTRYGLREDKDTFFVRSVEALDNALSSHNKKRSFLVTTFHRSLRIRNPDLIARIEKDWTRARTFPATIGDGQITVWKSNIQPNNLGS